MTNKATLAASILILTLLFPTGLCFARWQYEFDRISIGQGISQSDITDILQDGKGFMWFATNNGLNRYDGYDFNTFKNDYRVSSSISNNIVFSLSAEKERYMWVGTRTSIDRYDSHTGKFEHYTHAITPDKDTLHINRVTSIHMCRDGEVWALSRGFIMRYDKEENRFYSYIVKNTKTGEPLLAMNGIFEDAYGRLLIATNKGLYLFARTTFACRLFFSPDSFSKNRSSRILSVMVNPSNRLIYVGGEDGLFAIDYDGVLKEEILYNKRSITKISTLLSDSFGRTWIGTSERGLFVSDGEKVDNYIHDPSSPRTLGSNHILSLYEDLSGVLWIGTSTGGVSKLTLNTKPFHNIRHNPRSNNTLSDNVIFSVFVDKDSVAWISTKNGILNRYDIRTGVFAHYTLPSYKIQDDNVKIHTITAKDDDLLWLGTNHGLHIFDKRTGSFRRPNVKPILHDINVRSLLREGKDSLWIASRNHGVFLLVGEELDTHYNRENKRLSDNMVRCIVRNVDGTLLIGTRDGGVNIVSADGKTTKIIRELKSHSVKLSLDNVTAIHPDSHGNLWIGTWGGGLYKIENGKLEKGILYNEKDGLSDNVIFSIYEDFNGLLWISTYNGLSCLDPVTKRFRNYTISDGLASNEFLSGASYMDWQGHIWLGGIEGLTVFNPEKILASKFSTPRIAITRLYVENQEVKPGDIRHNHVILDKEIYSTDHITLSYKDRSFSFDLSSFSYGSEGGEKFYYMMKGLDSDWKISNQRRTISYSNIKPGNYTFVVKAYNADGVASDEYKLAITITPPWWNSNWAHGVYVLLSIALIYLLVMYYRRYNKNKTRRMHESIALDNEQKLYDAKMRFYTNISHELRTPLTLIHGLTNRISNEIDKNSRLGNHVTVMKRNTERLLKLINELLDLRRVETGNNRVKLQNKDIVVLLKTVWSYFESEAESKGISYSFQSDFESYNIALDFEKTEKIVYNLLSNALKFTKSVIKLDLRSETKDGRKYISVSVQDDGIGIKKNDQEKIFYRFYQAEEEQRDDNIGSGIGLHMAMELAKSQEGAVEVSSEYGDGATFTLYLPTDLEVEEGDDSYDQNDGRSTSEDDNRPMVLIIDDSEDMRYYISQSLSENYKVSEAVNGKEGLEMAEKILPDIIICDVMMPEMDGIEFVKRMKASTATSSIPIILATAKSSDEARVEGLNAGAEAYIIKPFTEEHLRAQINTTLKLREEISDQLRIQLMTSPKKVELKSPQDKLLNKIVESIEKNISNPDYDVDMLSKDVYMSRMHLYRQLKLLIGQTPSDFIRDFRLTRAADLLGQNKLNVAEITYMVGFSSPKYFSQSFRKKYGMSPNEYAIKNKDKG